MTGKETGIIMDILTTAYPKFYSGPDAPDPRKVMSLWAEMFRDDPVQTVAAAVKALIATDDRGFPPHIGAVKAKIRQLTAAPELSEQEAWAMVSRAIQNGIYGSEREFARLPEPVQRVVGSPNQLREWAVMDADAVQSVVSSNFQRSYRARAQQSREFDALPQDVKAVAHRLGGAIGRDALGDGRA